MTFLNNEDVSIVKKIIKGRMKFGIFFLFIVTLIFGLIFFAGIFGNNHSESPTVFGFLKLGIFALLFYFFGIKFLIMDSLKMFQRLSDGDYKVYKFEIYRCWKERVIRKEGKDYRYYLEALYLGDDGTTKIIKERIDFDDYSRIKDYKYAHVIHFYKKDGKIKQYDNGITINTTVAGVHFFYKGTNTL